MEHLIFCACKAHCLNYSINCVSIILVFPELRYKVGGTINVMQGQNVTLNCTADGISQPNFIWRQAALTIDTNLQIRYSTRNTSVSAFRDRVSLIGDSLSIDLSTTSYLTITNLDPNADTALYQCLAQNELLGRGVQLETAYYLNISRSMYTYLPHSICVCEYAGFHTGRHWNSHPTSPSH